MSHLKNTIMAGIALSSSAVFAGTMGPVCIPELVTVPCEHNAWDFGIQALYLKSHYNQDFAWVAAATSPTTPTATTYIDYDLSRGWGWRLEGSYHFSMGNDLNVNWIHYNNDSDQNFIMPTDPVFAPLAGAGSYGLAVEQRFDAFNVEFGQHVDFGQYKNIRFHGGVQYARIRTNTDITGANLSGVPFSGSAQHNMRFIGYGPRTGADMSFEWGNGLGIYAKPAAGLLVGTSKFSAVELASPGSITSVYGSKKAVVPELEAKLGATYTYGIASGNFILDGGWLWVNYFNVHNGVNFFRMNGGNVPGAGVTDFNISGPYIGLKWVGSFV